MLSFWRLETSDDFFLVESPPLAIASKVRAYHLELLNRVRYVENYHLVAVDEIAFQHLANYYEKVSKLLGFASANLLPASRHSFFIAAEKRGDFWISGLEMLMGYDFEGQEAEGRGQEVRVTSGDGEIDLLAELLLLPNTSQVRWLTETKSHLYLTKLVNQVGDRLRGKEAVEELQRKKDLEILETANATEQLRKVGFSL